ncbi:MAM and LDL-receptor class A domain-containing protein 1-like [Patiria miniata]|uniref:Uncharacterized protein n=1 Tax=Patiria miniata TaxID=46514 RepID=A0A914B780_PATMI|nr:MAM and LDL-receptor class A domain-containing protein 1-like [Patiria miniata]
MATVNCSNSEALGMQDGTIPNDHITASSGDGCCLAWMARLHNNIAWVPLKCLDAWIEVDLLQSTVVSGVTTQGWQKSTRSSLVTTKYKVAYKKQPSYESERVKDVNGDIKVFVGNTNSNTRSLACSMRVWWRRLYTSSLLNVRIGRPTVPLMDLKCDFDSYNLCRFNNSQNDDFDWTLDNGGTPSSGTGPNADHTLGTSNGVYIYTEASIPRLPSDKARLDSPKAIAPATGACVRFWYHMYGTGMGSLTVYTGDGQGGLGPARWSANGTSGNKWFDASIDIDPGVEFQVSFVGECGSDFTSDIAIDDISVHEEKCRPTVPLMDLKCDFDSYNLCRFNNSQNDDFDWTLDNGGTPSSGTGPNADHTLGTSNGVYIYTEASSPRLPSDKARLDSPKAIAPATGACVRFWYHMYGTGMGSLTVYTGDGQGGLGPARWSANGTSGNTWLEAAIDIAPGIEIQVSFVGERGNDFTGDMAVDDISVDEGQCNPTVPLPVLNCDFNSNNLCQFINNQNDDFDWTLNDGNTPSTDTGPDSDHSTTNSSGFYIYTEASSPRLPSDKARLDSPKAIAPATGACVRFWYHMYGADMGSLTVYTGDGQGGLGPACWSASGNASNKWFDASIDIDPGVEYQVSFVGERGSDFTSDIAIDDISFHEEKCRPTVPLMDLKCDFDSYNLCQFNNSQNDDFDWTLDSGGTGSSGTGPNADHTLGTSNGVYIYTEASSPRLPSDKARLDSPKAIAPATGACVRFWYHMYGANMGSLTVYTGDGQGGLGPARWSANGTSGNKWLDAAIDIAPGIEVQVSFVGERGNDFTGDMAVDDISVDEGQCNPTAPLPVLNCDFNSNNLCQFINNQNDDFDWTLNNGNTPSTDTGPDSDHSTTNSSGFYIYTEASSPRLPSDKARLDSPKAIAPATGACVRFWYHMYGADMGSLTVYTGDGQGGLGHARWSASGNASNKWFDASIDIDPGVEYQVSFVGERGSDFTSDIAIDDISVHEEKCGPTVPLMDLKCDFDSYNLCQFNNSQNDDFDWTLDSGGTGSSGTGPNADHTLGTSNGVYIYTEASSPRLPSDKARLDSPKAIAPATGACVRFWYHMYGADMGSLTVYTGDGQGGLGPARWSANGTSGNKWLDAAIDIAPGIEVQVSFVGERGNDYKGDMAVDDISVDEGQCNPTVPLPVVLNCDFNSNNLCQFINNQNDDFDWTLNNGNTPSTDTGPDSDHSTTNSSGFYIYTEASSPRLPSDKARLDSPKAIAPATGACVRFWYHMYGADMGSLTVYTGDGQGGLGPARWSASGNASNKWFDASIDIDPGVEYQVSFVGERGSDFTSDIAIDDISVHEEKCSGPTVPLMDLKCDFDSYNLCQFNNSQNDDFDWTLDSGGTGSSGTGPNADHTLGTSNGVYIYTEASSPRLPSDKARLDSPKAIAPATGACVRFWYHMYGADMGSLTVYTGDGQGGLGPACWSANGTSGNKWLDAAIDIAPGIEVQVSFVGERGNDYKGDMAVDDISVDEGQCNPTVPLPALNCDFDSNNLCQFINSKNDDFDWTLYKDTTPSVDTGPDADHTTRNSSGFYIYTEASAPRVAFHKARLDSPKAIAPATGACVRFWYHMFGVDVGSLTVYTGDGQGGLGPARWSANSNSGKLWIETAIDIASGVDFQVSFVGVRGSDDKGDIAIDDISYHEEKCRPTVPLMDLKCDFDSYNLCQFSNSQNDDFDWTLNRGGTPSLDTGPIADHTLGTSNGFYIYTETSDPRVASDKARLDSPKAIAPATGACVRFWYHMYGADMGSLTVYTGDGQGGLGPARWSANGTSGNKWLDAAIYIASGMEVRVSFVGERGNDYRGDMAVDDISVDEGPCNPTVPLPALNCDFNSNNLCQFINNQKDDFDWTLNNGYTPSSDTGPDSDHSTTNSSGFYIFTEASSPRFPSDKARLDSPKAIAPATGACVRFWYHMYGAHMGSLTVYTGDGQGGLGPARWSASGNASNNWFDASIDIDPGIEFQVSFMGERGSDFTSDIAIDDISVHEEICGPTVPLMDLKCDFDSYNLCQFNNSQNDDFDWTLDSGGTSSSSTGPNADHTQGNSNGVYIYTEASSPRLPSDKARLDSPKAIAPATGACVRFWYHMYGTGMGSLTVYTGDGQGGLGPARWSASDNYGNKWLDASIDIASGLEFRVIFIGERGSDYHGDMALDDISVDEGKCGV